MAKNLQYALITFWSQLTDHMHGLEYLVQLLRRKNAVKVNHRIYCSAVSKAFLVRKHPNLDERYVKDLFPNQPAEVRVFDKAEGCFTHVRVTAIPAQHCPGSVMFLFEKLDDGDGGGREVTRRVLYTGDFRLESSATWEDWSRELPALHGGADPLRIDEMYLDTTFCSDEYPTFPSRQEAMARVWAIVQDWVKKNGLYKKQKDKGRHVVLFHLPARYGYECILKHIYEQSNLKWRVHTSDSRFSDYLCANDLGDCVDSDSREALWIHACSWDNSGGGGSKNKNTNPHKTLPCQPGSFEVCHIKPSAMYFARSKVKDLKDKVVKSTGPQFFRVCFSCHSSLQELRDFVQHFMPAKLVPCAIPKSYTMQKVLDHFKDILPHDSIDLNATLGALGSLSPCGKGLDVKQMDFWNSPESSDSSRKRRNQASVHVQLSVCDGKRALFSDSGPKSPASNNNSSDDDDVLSCLKEAKSRRRQFHRSKSAFAHASLPTAVVLPSDSPSECSSNKSRRASLPYNMKIPAITITPCSPNGYANKDYPEFFEEQLYIQSKNNSASSSEGSNTNKDRCGSKDIMELDQSDTFSLKLSQDSVDMEQVTGGGGGGGGEPSRQESMSSCKTTTANDDHEVIDLSSGGVAADASYEEMESTPDLEEVMKDARTEEERANCDNFAKAQCRREQQQQQQQQQQALD